MRFTKLAVVSLLTAIIFTKLYLSAEAQGSYPGEKMLVYMVADTHAFVGHVTTCSVPGPPCLMGFFAPFPLSYLPYVMPQSVDPPSLYYPFTPYFYSPPPVKVMKATEPITFPSLSPSLRDIYYVPFSAYNFAGDAFPLGLYFMDVSFLKDADLIGIIPGLLQYIADFAEIEVRWPIRRITAPYGYSAGYFGGKVFHSGMDTSIHGCGNTPCNVVYAPIPLMPIATRGGWVMGIAPCELTRDMLYSENAFRKGIEKLERGEDRFGCAILFGAFHVVSETPYLDPGYCSMLYSDRKNHGRIPIELGVYTARGEAFALCASVPGYAGDFAPHCHYQAGIIDVAKAQELLRLVRQSPQEFYKPLATIAIHRSNDWGPPLDFATLYKSSIDPAILLWPQLFTTVYDWANHSWPAGVELPTTASPSAWWQDPSRGEFIAGIISDGIMEVTEDGICRLPVKEIPGYKCIPKNRNYYGGDASYSRRKQQDVAKKLEPVINNLKNVLGDDGQ